LSSLFNETSPFSFVLVITFVTFINTAEKIGDSTHYFTQAELDTQLEVKKHETYPLLVGRWFYTQSTLPSLYLQSAVFFWAKFRQNMKNEYEKGKSPHLWENFGFCFAPFALRF
jgi:hypothetical protein